MNSSKKVERTFRYGPYGENTKSEGTQTIPDPFGYKGGYRMPGGNKGEGNVSNGLYHFGAAVLRSHYRAVDTNKTPRTI